MFSDTRNAHDLPAFEQRLRAAGQRFETKPLADSGIWQIFLTDPDGARVQLRVRRSAERLTIMRSEQDEFEGPASGAAHAAAGPPHVD